NLGLTHSALDCLAHCTAESHTVNELLSDGLCNQGSVCVNLLDLKNVEGNHLAGELFQLAANAVSLSATAANHDARTSSVNVDADAHHAVFCNHDNVVLIGHFNQGRCDWAQPPWVNHCDCHALIFQNLCGAERTSCHRADRNDQDLLCLSISKTLLLRLKDDIDAIFGRCDCIHILQQITLRETHD